MNGDAGEQSREQETRETRTVRRISRREGNTKRKRRRRPRRPHEIQSRQDALLAAGSPQAALAKENPHSREPIVPRRLARPSGRCRTSGGQSRGHAWRRLARRRPGERFEGCALLRQTPREAEREAGRPVEEPSALKRLAVVDRAPVAELDAQRSGPRRDWRAAAWCRRRDGVVGQSWRALCAMPGQRTRRDWRVGVHSALEGVAETWSRRAKWQE